MKPARRVTFIVSVSLAVLLGLLCTSARNFILEAFHRLEEREVKAEVERCLGLIRLDTESLHAKCFDYSAWDPVYDLMVHPDEDFTRESLQDAFFEKGALSFFACFDLTGRPVHSKAYDLEARVVTPLPASLPAQFARGSPLLPPILGRDGRCGVLALAEGPYLVSIRPIEDSEQRLPARGVAVLGRHLSPGTLARYSNLTPFRYDMSILQDGGIPGDFATAWTLLQSTPAPIARTLGADTIAGYDVIRDIHGRPCVLARVSGSREALQGGVRAIEGFIYLAIGCGISVGIVILVLLHRNRLAALKPIFSRLRDAGILGGRQVPEGGDLSGAAAAVGDAIDSLVKNRRQLEEANGHVREAGDLFETVISAVPEAVLGTETATGRIRVANPFLCTLLGYSRDEVQALRVEDLAAPGDEGLHDTVESIRSDGTAPVSKGRLRARDGRTIDVEMLGTVARLEGRDSALIFARDVTQKLRMDEALRASEERYRILFTRASEAIFLAEADSGRILDANRRAEALLAMPRETIVGMHQSELHPPGKAEEYERIFSAHASESVYPAIEGEVRTADGRNVPVEITAATMTLGDGRRVIHGLFKDITDRKKILESVLAAKEAADAANRAKSAYLSTMSHEIRSPLNAILGMTSLLLDMNMEDEAREYVALIRASGQALLQLTNDILDLSRIEAGKLEFEAVDFEVWSVVAESLRCVGESAAAKSLDLAYLPDPGFQKTVRGDPGRLRQVLVNLLTNAVKFTNEGEVVVENRFVAEADGTATLRFEVRDTGVGLTREQRQRIFQPFAQGDPSTPRKYGGSGLGLWISRKLVEMMGGKIDVSGAPGKGSAFHFTVRLPIASSPSRPMAGNGIEGKKILVLVPGKTSGQALIAHLEGRGAEVHTPAHADRSGQSAAWKLDDDWDAAVIDADILEAETAILERIRVAAKAEGKPMVLLGTTATERHKMAAFQSIGARILLKPVVGTHLEYVLGEILACTTTAEART